MPSAIPTFFNLIKKIFNYCHIVTYKTPVKSDLC